MTKTVRVFETGSVFKDILLENMPQNIVWGNENADFAVIMPGYNGPCGGNYGVLLKPDGFACGDVSRTVITYGMGKNSTVTLSSVGEKRCVMTLQQEMETIWGKLLEPQDIVISRMHLTPHDALAVAAAMLIAGDEFTGI